MFVVPVSFATLVGIIVVVLASGFFLSVLFSAVRRDGVVNKLIVGALLFIPYLLIVPFIMTREIYRAVRDWGKPPLPPVTEDRSTLRR